MRSQSRDTDPRVEQLQIEGLRRLSPEQRFAIANRLTRSVFMLSWQNFHQRHADLSEQEAELLWVRLLYGDDLATRLAAYLARRQAE